MSRKIKKTQLTNAYKLFDDQSRFVLFQSILHNLKDDQLDLALISKNEINSFVVQKQVAEIEKQLDCKVSFKYQGGK
jgi:hypothetical protein